MTYENAMRRRLNDRELTELQERGQVRTLGGFTLASLIASVNDLGIGPEDVEVSGCGDHRYGIELWVVEPPTEEPLP